MIKSTAVIEKEEVYVNPTNRIGLSGELTHHVA